MQAKQKTTMNKHYVIIGGSSGIGFKTAELLQLQGHQISIFSRNNTIPTGTNHFTLNVLDETIDVPFDQPVDGLIYCPGSINLKPFSSLKLKDFEQDYAINVLGGVKTIKAFLPLLKKSASASIVLFSTVAVQTGLPYHTSISAAKGAVEGLTRSLAAEFAPKIRVNCIAPSLVETPLAGRLLSNERQQESAKERHPLKAFGQPEDIAEMAAFLISEKAKWTTGQIFHIDGGLSSLKV